VVGSGISRTLTVKADIAATLSIRADADPGTLPRVINTLTVRGLMPAFLSCRLSGAYVLIDVQMQAGHRIADETLVERLRALPCVDRVGFVGVLP
jgi:hypothetical protein